MVQVSRVSWIVGGGEFVFVAEVLELVNISWVGSELPGDQYELHGLCEFALFDDLHHSFPSLFQCGCRSGVAVVGVRCVV